MAPQLSYQPLHRTKCQGQSYMILNFSFRGKPFYWQALVCVMSTIEPTSRGYAKFELAHETLAASGCLGHGQIHARVTMLLIRLVKDFRY